MSGHVSMVGALGSWMKARPTGVTQDALDRAAKMVLGMQLLGVDLNDQAAPELASLSDADRAVVDHARIWAQARVEDSRRREVEQARAVHHAARLEPAELHSTGQPSVVAYREPRLAPAQGSDDRTRRPARTALVQHVEPRSEVVVVDPPWHAGDDIEVLPDRWTTRLRSTIARYEEIFWWAVCFVAVALLAWRQFG